MQRRTFVLAVFASAAAATGLTAHAQAPSTIRVVVPFTTGGPVDFSARVMVEKLRTQMNVPVIVENRPGANGTVAAMAVKNATPDGGTVLYTSNGMLTISPHLQKNLPWDALRDFVPVSTTSYAECGLVVPASMPVNNLKEFIALAKKSQPPLTFGSAGIGNILHAYIEVFNDEANVQLTHVPYKGASVALTDVIGGQTNGMFVGLSLAAPHIKAGKLKVFGVTGTQRSALLPEVATLEEQGIKGLDILSWSGVMAPKGTPPQVVQQLADAIGRAMNDPEVKAKLAAAGIAPWVMPADKFAATIRSESERWGKLVREKNIRIE
jgi:tripartite-type tricarboxylate transporter receptor subunit TctC